MVPSLVSIIIGLIAVIIGIMNINGNISTIHSYHRHRVTKENEKPFGRLVGSGTLTIGAGVIVFGMITYIAEKIQNESIVLVGTVILLICLIVGIVLSFYGMIKYNKGIF